MPVPMHGGKMYATVNERLRAAHLETPPKGIQSIFTETISVMTPHGPGAVVRATITFLGSEPGQQFTGIAEVPFDGQRGPEKTNPWEVAETSAVGRALAMAGYYGSDDGLAGAEEMREAQRRQNLPPRGQPSAPSGRTAVANIPDVPDPEVPAEFAGPRRMSTANRVEQQQRQNAPAVKGAGFITEPQIRLISRLLKDLKEPMPPNINELSVRDASAKIEELKFRTGQG